MNHCSLTKTNLLNLTHTAPLSSEARADQGCRKRRNQVPDWSEIRCRFPPKSPAAFDRNQVPLCSDFCIEAGRDGFWLARWLEARGVEAHVIHPSSVAVFAGTSPGEHRPARHRVAEARVP